MESSCMLVEIWLNFGTIPTNRASMFKTDWSWLVQERVVCVHSIAALNVTVILEAGSWSVGQIWAFSHTFQIVDGHQCYLNLTIEQPTVIDSKYHSCHRLSAFCLITFQYMLFICLMLRGNKRVSCWIAIIFSNPKMVLLRRRVNKCLTFAFAGNPTSSSSVVFL